MEWGWEAGSLVGEGRRWRSVLGPGTKMGGWLGFVKALEYPPLFWDFRKEMLSCVTSERAEPGLWGDGRTGSGFIRLC